MAAIHPEIQEIIDALVGLIKEGESLANVADRGMLMARRLAPGTTSLASTDDIPQARSSECEYNDDSAFLAWTYNDDYLAGVRLANLAIDQIRAEDILNGTTTPVTSRDHFTSFVQRFIERNKITSFMFRESAESSDDYPRLMIGNRAAKDLYSRVNALPYAMRFEFAGLAHQIGMSIPEGYEKAEKWLHWNYPEYRGRSSASESAEIAVFLSVYEVLLKERQES